MRLRILLLAFGLSLLMSAAVLAATGYKKTQQVWINGVMAASLAAEFISVGAWSGAVSDMHSCLVTRRGGGPTSFIAICTGKIPIAAGTKIEDLPAEAVDLLD